MSGIENAMTYLLRGDWLLGGLCKFFLGSRVMSEIVLATNEDDGKALAEMEDFGDPL